mmetsp:Transcript_8170/g.15065  ORF Transcript_8170/g.15065 Transcript_8170/m.15065 type:complete len:85 (-) Transcript_8170:87-341(-)
MTRGDAWSGADIAEMRCGYGASAQSCTAVSTASAVTVCKTIRLSLHISMTVTSHHATLPGGDINVALRLNAPGAPRNTAQECYL